VKQPDLVRRCFTCSVPGALFLLALEGFEAEVVIFNPSGATKKVVRGVLSMRALPAELRLAKGGDEAPVEADDVAGRWVTSGVE
jgi:hypothetical protein